MAHGYKTGGRRKGTPNRRTVAVKEAIETVYEGMGGTEAMLTWAREHPGEFYQSLFAKLLPRDLNLSQTVDVASAIDAARQRALRIAE